MYLFHSNCSKTESHVLDINIIRQKTGPGIPSELRSGDSLFLYAHNVIPSSIENVWHMCAQYFLKFPIVRASEVNKEDRTERERWKEKAWVSNKGAWEELNRTCFKQYFTSN